jgi:hypothetical protein
MSDCGTHLHPDAQQALSLSPSQRCEFAERPRWIDYPAAVKALQRLLEAPTLGVKGSVLLGSAAHNGITSLLNRLLETLQEKGRALEVSIVSVPKDREGLDGIHRGILQHLRRPAASGRTKYTDHDIVGVLAANAIDLLILEGYPIKGHCGSRLEYGSVMQLKTPYNTMDMPFHPEVYSIPIVVILQPAEAQRVIRYPELARRFQRCNCPCGRGMRTSERGSGPTRAGCLWRSPAISPRPKWASESLRHRTERSVPLCEFSGRRR